jgi:hypothetical protein
MTRLSCVLAFSALAVLLPTVLVAQKNRITFRAPYGKEHACLGDSRQDFLKISSRAEQGRFEPEAAAILKGAQDSTEALFSPKEFLLKAKTTYRDSEGDNLAALWSFASDSFSGSIALEDTPFYSTFAIQLRSPTVASRDDVAFVLSSILKWNERPLLLQNLELLHEMAGSSLCVYAYRLSSEYEANNLVRLVGITHTDAWYVTFEVGKGVLSGFYPYGKFIPERFPPLAELVTRWPSERLWNEIRRPLTDNHVSQYSELRDSVVTEEIARRGLTVEKVVELLRIGNPHGFVSRARITAGVLERVRPGWIDLYFKEALDMYEVQGSPDAARVIIGIAARHCSAEKEEVANNMLDARNVGPDVAHYLIKCSNSPKALERVRSMFEAGQLREYDKFGVEQMENRITSMKR